MSKILEPKNFDCLLDKTRQVLDELTDTAPFLYVDDIEDDSIAHLDPIKNLSKKDIRLFFEKQIRADLINV